MKLQHVFDHSDYFHTLHGRIHDQIPVYQGYRQQGAGFGSFFRIISNYAIPIIKKYILPRAKEAILSTTSDVISGAPLKQSIKERSKTLFKNIATDILDGKQSGSGLRVT